MKKWVSLIILIVGTLTFLGTIAFMYTLVLVDSTYAGMIESYKDPAYFEKFQYVPDVNITALQEYSIAMQEQSRKGLFIGWVWAFLVLITSAITIDIGFTNIRKLKK